MPAAVLGIGGLVLNRHPSITANILDNIEENYEILAAENVNQPNSNGVTLTTSYKSCDAKGAFSAWALTIRGGAKKRRRRQVEQLLVTSENWIRVRNRSFCPQHLYPEAFLI